VRLAQAELERSQSRNSAASNARTPTDAHGAVSKNRSHQGSAFGSTRTKA
jgi:hypothetical protein